MTPAGYERLQTWACEIVEVLVEGVKWRQEGDERHAIGQGGLSINTRLGYWHSHSASKGGKTPISLVELLKGCSTAEARKWCEAWLTAHPGTGSISTGNSEDDHAIANAIIALQIINKLVDPCDTPVEIYLKSRAITGPIPEW